MTKENVTVEKIKGFEIETFKDDEGDWIARVLSNERKLSNARYKYLSGISKYRKCAIRILFDAISMGDELLAEEENREKVYCMECRHFRADTFFKYERCDAPDNLISTYKDRNVFRNLEYPRNLNRQNDCKLFEKNEK